MNNKADNYYNKVIDFLSEKKSIDNFRTIKEFEFRHCNKIIYNGDSYVNFTSNDYLGLSSNQQVVNAGIKASQEFGSSSTSSRLVIGSLPIHRELERKLTQLKSTEDALLFNTGFQCNSTIFPSLLTNKIAGTNPLIISDRLAHNSILFGINACNKSVKHKRFKHNDPQSLEKILSKESSSASSIFVVFESIYSMDGDIAPLSELISISKRYNALTIVDEAHSSGVYGKNGSGLCQGLKVDIIMGTLSKAIGSQGAFIASSQSICQYLTNTCNGLIYSTALPPFSTASALEAIRILHNYDKERKQLQKYSKQVRETLKNNNYNYGSSKSHIIPIIVGNNKDTLNLQTYFRKKGLWLTAIRPPTVKENSSRLRVTLSSRHTQDEIDNLCNIISSVNKDNSRSCLD